MAGLGKKTFVAGEVLLAQDVNGYLMDQSVMVFGGTAARSSAIPTPTEGMMSYRTDDNVVEVFDGSAYVGVGGGASGALTLISATTVGTAVTSVTVNDAFSATYDNYFITYNDGAASATNNLELRLGATTTGYYWNIVGNTWSPTASNTGGTNSSAFAYTGSHNSTTGSNAVITVQSPFLAKRTVIQSQHVETTGGFSMNGMLNNTTSYTSFILLAGSGNLTGGTIRVYGYANS
jgi:hypothetical protein